MLYTEFSVLRFEFQSTENMNESDGSNTSPNLQDCAHVPAQTGNTEGKMTAEGAVPKPQPRRFSTTWGLETGAVKTFSPAKSLPSIRHKSGTEIHGMYRSSQNTIFNSLN